jgi:uncharacterized peroxidase-related enzyme
MSFQIHTLETAPAAAREGLGRLVQSYGFLPNLAGVIAESPAALNGLLALMGAFDSKEMSLGPLERQIVLLTASVRNRCAYCAAAHGMMANMNGLDRREVETLQQGGPLRDARLNALRRFVEAVLDKRGWVEAADLEPFFAAGFTRAQVLEVVSGVALKTFTNYVNHIANPPVNAQFAPFLPAWEKAA